MINLQNIRKVVLLKREKLNALLKEVLMLQSQQWMILQFYSFQSFKAWWQIKVNKGGFCWFSSKVTRLKSSNSSRPLFWEFHSKKNAKLFSTSQYLRIVGGGTNNSPLHNAQTQTKPRLRDGIKNFIACCKTWIDRCKKTEGPKVLKCQNIYICKNFTHTLRYHQKFTVSEFFIPESIFCGSISGWITRNISQVRRWGTSSWFNFDL